MIHEKLIYYIIPILIILLIFIIFFIYKKTKNKNNTQIIQKNTPINTTKKINNFIYKCQYKLQSYNNGYVLIDKNNNIIKQFKSKQQYLNYVY